MNEEFEKWRRDEYGVEADFQETFAIAALEEAFLAGAAAMREKAAEMANNMATDCPSEKCPEHTDMDDCMYKETGFCIAAAIRKLEVE